MRGPSMNPSCWRMAQICNHTTRCTQAWKSPCSPYVHRDRSRWRQVSFCTSGSHSTPELKNKPLTPPPEMPPIVSPGAKDLAFTTWDNVALLVDKPGKWTSNDVCGKLKFSIGRKWKRGTRERAHKVGHAGTLDPMATGLLIVCMGRATKKLSFYMEQVKEYTGTIRLGEATSTMDAESKVEEVKEWKHLTDEDILSARDGFVGDVQQIPPMFSAVKVQGSRLYKLARAGQEIEREPRTIHVEKFDISREPMSQDVDFRIVCSKGAYIRSLAHDLGQSLGCGAHMIKLCRTAIGNHRVEDAWSVDDLVRAIKETRGVIAEESKE